MDDVLAAIRRRVRRRLHRTASEMPFWRPTSSKATLTFETTDAGWSVTNIHLELVGSVPGADAETVTKLANVAKQDCPISRLLKTNITLDAKLKD